MGQVVTTKNKAAYTKKYKCPYCEDRVERDKMSSHIEKKHKDMIPEGYTAARVAFNTVNKKSSGHCIICRNETDWNEDKCRYERLCNNPACKKAYVKMTEDRLKARRGVTKSEMLNNPEFQNKMLKGRYERLCNNPACKKAYVKMTEDRLKARRGVTKSEMLNNPEFQNKMLKGRSISGTYKFTDGGKIDYVGSYEKNFLEFMDKFLHVKSSDIEAPGPTVEYYYEGKKHFWITDFYYIPYNLVLDIKDGGNNPNKREMPEYRAKQKAKEKAIADSKMYNYIRLTDNNMPQLIDIMMDLKDSLMDMEGPFDQRMSKIKPIIRINEGYIRLLNDFKDPRYCDWDEELTYKSIHDAISSQSGLNLDKPIIRINEGYIRLLNDFKDPRYCDWDEELTYKSIHDAISSQSGLNLDNELHVYDMDPDTYKKEYIGSIKVNGNGKYEWIKQESVLVEDTLYLNPKVDDLMPRMFCIMMTDPDTYRLKDLSDLEQYASDIEDIYELLEISTYLRAILQEHSERWVEYYKYLYSGKCSWVYQHDCETFKKNDITLEDMTEIGDKLRDINHIIRNRR